LDRVQPPSKAATHNPRIPRQFFLIIPPRIVAKPRLG
jgi:hypothetical protein